MASTVLHQGQQISIENPDQYNKLSFKEKNAYLDSQIQAQNNNNVQTNSIQNQPQAIQTSSNPVSVPANQIQYGASTQQATPTIQQNIPTKQVQPQQVQQEQPKPQDNQKIVESAYSKYGIQPSSQEKVQEHLSNIQQWQQSGYYQNTQQAQQDVEKAIANGLSWDQMFNAIRTGGVDDNMKQNPNFQTAMQRVNNVNAFANATPTNRSAMAKTIYSGSQEERDLVNAGYGQMLSMAKNVSTLNSSIQKSDIVSQTDTMKGQSIAQSILSSLTGGQSALQSYVEATQNNPEYQQKLEAKQQAMAEYKKKKDSWDQIEMDTYDEFKGTGATETYIQNLISQRRRNLLPELNQAQRNYENMASSLTDYMDQVKTQINYQTQDQQTRMQQAQLATSLYAPTIKYQQEQALQSQNLQQTAPSIVSEISNEVVGGINNPEMWNQRAIELAQQGYNRDQIKSQLMGEMGQMRKQSGEQFMTYDRQKQQQALNIEAQKTAFDQQYKSAELGLKQQEMALKASEVNYVTDPMTGQQVAVPKYASGVSAMNTTQLNQAGYDDQKIARVQQAQNAEIGEYYGQCGAYINNLDGLQSGFYGDSLSSKVSKIDKPASNKWDIGDNIILDMGTKEGHVGKVVGETDDFYYMQSSNYNNDGKISIDPISKKDSRIKGFTSEDKILTDSIGGSIYKTAQNILNWNGSIAQISQKRRELVMDAMENILERKTQWETDPNRIQIMMSARETGNVDATSRQKLVQAQSALSDIPSIYSSLSKVDTWPIAGTLANLNPWKSGDLAEVNAQIIGSIPTVARGIFNEVWVLTDKDVALYKQTLPTLKNTQEQLKAITNIMLSKVANSIQNQLTTLAGSGINTSKFLPLYDKTAELQRQQQWPRDILGQLGDYGMAWDETQDPLWLFK